MPVFRLREALRERPDLLAGLGTSPDPLGWVDLKAVRRVLRSVFVEGRLAFDSALVLLDNFPGTAGQLALLAETAGFVGARVAVLEVRAEVATVVRRVATRRVCWGCGPDSHAPAVPAADDTERCIACGARLSRRDSDVPRLHGLRMARYAANLPEIAEAARRRGIPHLVVDADQDGPEVCRLARHVLGRLIASVLPVSADLPGSRP